MAVREANVDVIPTHIFRMHQEYADIVRNIKVTSKESLLLYIKCTKGLLDFCIKKSKYKMM